MEEKQEMSMEVGTEDELFFDAEDFPTEDGDQHIDEDQGGEESEEGKAQEEPSEDGEEGTPSEEGPPEGTEQLHHLKWPDGEGDFTLKEVLEFAGKGKDRERVVQQRDALRNSLQEQLSWRAQNEDVLNVLSDMAKQSNMDLSKFVESLQENMLVKSGGMTRDAARERIEKEKLQRQLKSREQADLKNQEAAMRQTRAQKEIEAFNAKYPDVDVKAIPKEVFQRAASGETSLIGAYTEHLNSQLHAEIKKLQAELAAEKQNKANRQKAVGSAKTDGANAKYDDFLSGFNE